MDKVIEYKESDRRIYIEISLSKPQTKLVHGYNVFTYDKIIIQYLPLVESAQVDIKCDSRTVFHCFYNTKVMYKVNELIEEALE